MTKKELVEEFAARGPDGVIERVNAALRAGTPSKDIMFLLIWTDHLPLLQAVLRCGIDVNVTNRAGQTPLYEAASVGFPEEEPKHRSVCELLIQKGADLNRRHLVTYEFPPLVRRGDTALMCAARTDSVSIAELLLGNGADPRIKDDAGLTALDHARSRESKRVIRILCRYP